MYLGNSFESILEDYEIDLMNYNEAMRGVDAHLQQEATIKANLKSLYSNKAYIRTLSLVYLLTILFQLMFDHRSFFK